MQGIYEQFSYVVSVINRHIQKIERDEMIKHGHKGAFAQYLMAMRHCPEGVTAAQLSEICDKDKAAVSRVIAEMVEKGLVMRTSQKETMYRAKLTLTQEGKKVAEFVSQRAMAAVTAVGNELTDEQRRLFYGTLEFIAARLQTLSHDGIPQ